MPVNFRARIRWPRNPLLLPASLFHIQIPAGLSPLDVRAANFVDVAGMQRVARSGIVRGYSMAILNGLVRPEFHLRFADLNRQWRRLPHAGVTVRSATHGPARFQFTGGNVFLELSLSLYILNTHQPRSGDSISEQIFSVVYSHELLHVLDQTSILYSWLPPRARSEPTVDRYLVQAQPIVYGTARQGIDEVERRFRRYIHNRLETDIGNLFAGESDRRTRRRDAPAQYRIVQQRIDALRIRQVNP